MSPPARPRTSSKSVAAQRQHLTQQKSFPGFADSAQNSCSRRDEDARVRCATVSPVPMRSTSSTAVIPGLRLQLKSQSSLRVCGVVIQGPSSVFRNVDFEVAEEIAVVIG